MNKMSIGKLWNKLTKRTYAVNITIDKKSLDELQRLSPWSTYPQIIRRALTIFKYLMAMKKEGNQIVLERKIPKGDGDDRILLVLED